jgi:protein TonB
MSSTALQRYEGGGKRRRAIGWAVVGGVHVLVAYGLVSGTARQGLELVKKPLEAVVIQEVIIPPPPPPPRVLPSTPPPQAQPRMEPPPYVPPAEVAPPAALAIAASPVPQAPPPAASPSPPVAAAAVERAEMSVVCPTQVKPEMPRRAARGVSGVVLAQASIAGGAVREVRILSGPGVFHAAVREAMLQYKCNNGNAGEVLATQEFVFRVE